jgi:hypothetical protein
MGARVTLTIGAALLLAACGALQGGKCPKPVAYDDATLKQIQEAMNKLPQDSVLRRVLDDYEAERDDLRFCK